MTGNPQYTIGVDIGTTGCRALVVDSDLHVAAEASAVYPLDTPHPGWGEQNPEAIFQAVVMTVGQAVKDAGCQPGALACLAFSSAMHSILAVNPEGMPLSPAITWADSRSVAEAEELGRDPGLAFFYNRTGCRMHPMYPAAKLAWWRKHRPDLWKEAARFISIKEYVIFRLTGRYAIDYSIASATALFNLFRADWDDAILDVIGLSRDRLSPVFPPQEIIEGIVPEWAARMGISPSLPVVLGASDGMLSNVGAGAVGPGQMTFMIGTSGAQRFISEEPKLDSDHRTWCYMFDRHVFLPGGSINNGGIVLRWVRDSLLAGGDYDELTRLAATVPPGSEGLVILPFLTGERCPGWRPDAKGTAFGFTIRHGKAHWIRAAMEGVIYRMYSVYEALEKAVGPAVEIRATGGFTRSSFWLQMAADVLGRRMIVPAEADASAIGAAYTGHLALGRVPNLESIRDRIAIKGEVYPDMEAHRAYAQAFQKYQAIYRCVAPEF